MEMVQEQKSVPILSLFVPVSFRRHEGPMQGKCMGVKKKRKGKKGRKKGRKKNESEKLREIDNRSSVIELSLLQRDSIEWTRFDWTQHSQQIVETSEKFNFDSSLEWGNIAEEKWKSIFHSLTIYPELFSLHDIYIYICFMRKLEGILDEYARKMKRNASLSVTFYLT